MKKIAILLLISSSFLIQNSFSSDKTSSLEKTKKVEFLKTLQNGWISLPKDRSSQSLKDKCLSDCAYIPLNIDHSPDIKSEKQKQCAETFETKFNEITSAINIYQDQPIIPVNTVGIESPNYYMLAYNSMVDLANFCSGYANQRGLYEMDL